MSEQQTARPAQTLGEAYDALLSRWPETRLEPSLDRIAAFVELLGDPQRAAPVVHLTGTNGKTSTARMIDDLLRAAGLRTGRFTSPHVESVTERISLDGEPLSDEEFVRIFNDVAPYTHLVDSRSEHPLSFFEAVVGMAFAAFADAPVDAAVVEVGMGGAWDATNVADADVAVLLPVAIDHTQYLGTTTVDIAREKVGIIKPGSLVVSATQDEDVAAVIAERVAEVGARLVREDEGFGVVARTPAVGGQVVTIEGLHATYVDLFLPLYGEHQAHNAAAALAAVEALVGRTADGEPLADELVREAFATFTSPGRLEIVRRSPTMLLDAAHNRAGAAAAAAALDDSFAFSPLIGVASVMADKDVDGMLAELEPHLAHLVCTRASTDRAMDPEALAVIARELFGDTRVTVADRLPEAIDQAAALAEAGQALGEAMGSGAVLITGSVVTVGEARALLGRTR
ncbi:Mur ligase family protein [uncultured Nocardioides sp.]|uniref:bifunctional folylpolyglutamate synthase/dihydrofolate synthase n=1 Tax=uncultured Nocardioides sp. TaxID=198441 RepID=UPI00261911B7|nr:Mur ligase family protein [uncultured Nocardioides sp.]